MRKFGVQKFLNDVSSAGNGWLKFNIIPGKAGHIGFETNFILADCRERVEIEFEPRMVYRDAEGRFRKSQIERSLKSIKHRRGKAALLRDAMNLYFENLNLAYDEMEEQINNIPLGSVNDDA